MRTLGLTLLLAACAVPADAGGNIGAATVPADAVVLGESAIDMATQQCSRATPAAGERYWRPEASDVAPLEAALAAERQPQDWSNFPEAWRRQYVGIVREGRRYVYGNFYPRSADDHAADADRWRREPVLVCDGGPAFFGVEYDVEAGRISHLAFNGMI